MISINFLLLLRTGVYPYEYMGGWQEFTETSLPEEFYSNLNMDDITDADYIYVKRVCQDFVRKNLGEYHNVYLKSDTLLLTDVFENFLKMCIAIYHLDPAKFLSAPGSAWETALKKTEVKLKLLTDIDKLLIIEKYVVIIKYIKCIVIRNMSCNLKISI